MVQEVSEGGGKICSKYARGRLLGHAPSQSRPRAGLLIVVPCNVHSRHIKTTSRRRRLLRPVPGIGVWQDMLHRHSKGCQYSANSTLPCADCGALDIYSDISPGANSTGDKKQGCSLHESLELAHQYFMTAHCKLLMYLDKGTPLLSNSCFDTALEINCSMQLVFQGSKLARQLVCSSP